MGREAPGGGLTGPEPALPIYWAAPGPGNPALASRWGGMRGGGGLRHILSRSPLSSLLSVCLGGAGCPEVVPVSLLGPALSPLSALGV